MAPFHDLTLKTITGGDLQFSELKGKLVLIVNVASKCGYTKQYAGLEALNKKYASKGLFLLGCPSNEFGKQEPGSEAEILEFCSRTFDVTFPMAAKLEVNGANASPVYQFLKAETGGADIRWNFEKFLINTDGSVIGRYQSGVTPEELDTIIESKL